MEARSLPRGVLAANAGAVASPPARGVYRARRPRESALWRLFDEHYEEFEAAYEGRFEETYGELRPVVGRVVEGFRKCGILDFGFAEVTAVPPVEQLERVFRHKVLRMLLSEGAIDDKLVAKLLSWHHTGFGAFIGHEIPAADRAGREAVARYLVHPPVVVGRILTEGEKVVYKGDKVHPRHKESRGTRKAKGEHAASADPSAEAPAQGEGSATETDRAPIEVRRNWARLLRKVYEVDPLICTRCGGTMQVVALIEKPAVIERILRHLKLWPTDGEPAKGAGRPPPSPRSGSGARPGWVSADRLQSRTDGSR